ncbi:hypothetical protein [Aeromonas salmonicida]|uniref:hypothetical protein n=1 Tax=Aeromonas salmonicida TaxID=645 RepID=UPI0038BC349C
MSNLLEQGITGIITGIITTAFLFLIKSIWSTKIVPFLASTRYQGVLIGGQWASEDRNDAPENGDIFEIEANLFLNQNAHHLDGSLLFKYKSTNKSFSLDFSVSGYMWEGYVTLNFSPKDKRITSYGTTLLKLHDGGSTLVGTWLFRDVISEKVSHVPITLIREQRCA